MLILLSCRGNPDARRNRRDLPATTEVNMRLDPINLYDYEERASAQHCYARMRAVQKGVTG